MQVAARHGSIRWPAGLALLVLTILFIPINRYELPGGLPFQLEPYRILVAILVTLWIGSLLIDPRVRLRTTGLEGPLLFIVAGAAASDMANPSHVSALASNVAKSLTFFVSFFLVVWMITSLVRTRGQIDSLLKLLVAGGAILAIAAMVERRTHYNVFNHLSTVMPFLRYQGIAVTANGEKLVRGGAVRAIGPSQHPIAFSVLFVLLLPLALYLAHRYRRGRWVVMAGLLVLGLFATASRTGIVALVVIGGFYLALKPRAVVRLWPVLLAGVLGVQLLMPGALGNLRQEFFPKGGLIANQADVQGDVGSASGRLAKARPAIDEWSRSALLGEGFGTRVTTGPTSNARILDDQWLGTLLETGFIGFVGWLWLFVRSIRRLVRAAGRAAEDDSWLLVGLAASSAAFGVSMIAYDAFSFVQTFFVFFILLAIGCAFLNVLAAEAERVSVLPATVELRRAA